MPLYPRADWTTAFPTTDLSGNPTIVVDLSRAYFAFLGGSVGSINTTGYSSVVVGCVDLSGNPLWTFRDARMITNANDTHPTLTLGDNALFVSYTTLGAISGATNGKNTFSFCGNCSGPQSGYEDIVVARIDNLTNPSLTWIQQDGYLNSCNKETNPQLWYDTTMSRLLLAYQCSGATLCKNPVGTANVVVAALDLSGGLSWAYQQELLNGPGNNQSPSLTTDLSGNIYVAYTIDQQVQGGSLQGTTDVEVVKLHAHIEGCNVVVEREWILSAVATVNASGAVNANPSISCSPTGSLCLTFTTTGQVPGGIHTTADRDIVFVGLNPNGTLQWIQQNPYFNEDTYRYQSVDSSQTIQNCNSGIYTIGHAQDVSGIDMLLMWKTSPTTGEPEWFYQPNVAQRYRTYIPVARFATPFAAQTTTAELSNPAVAICSSILVVAVANYTVGELWVFGISQQEPYSNIPAFEYFLQSSRICARNCTACS
jgi:hypothetical protein